MENKEEKNEINQDNKMMYAIIMHEVKTSLLCMSSVLRGMLETGDYLPEKIAMCEREMARMTESLMQILDASYMLAKEYKSSIAAVNLQEYAVFLEHMYGTLAKEKNKELRVKVESEAYRYLYLDRTMLTHILNNLVTNAVKYSDENGCVEIVLRSVYVEEYRVLLHILVQNTGMGMSKQFQKKAFDLYAREENNRSEGNGIGLSIVKKMIDIMNGTITIDSEQGKGMKTEISMQVDGADEFFENAAGEQNKCNNPCQCDFKGKKILVSEDDELFINWIADTLEKHGMSVDKTYDGNEVTDLFVDSQEGEYQAILMDLNMTGMGGIEAAHYIRESARNDAETIPILAYTGMPIEDEESFLAKHKMQMVVPKVFVEEEIITIFARLFGMTEDNGEFK